MRIYVSFKNPQNIDIWIDGLTVDYKGNRYFLDTSSEERYINKDGDTVINIKEVVAVKADKECDWDFENPLSERFLNILLKYADVEEIVFDSETASDTVTITGLATNSSFIRTFGAEIKDIVLI